MTEKCNYIYYNYTITSDYKATNKPIKTSINTLTEVENERVIHKEKCD